MTQQIGCRKTREPFGQRTTEFPDGSGALHQTAEGCGISGNTPLPGVDNFSDGIIQAVFSWQDDDGVGFQFRRVGDNRGYLVALGYNETPPNYHR